MNIWSYIFPQKIAEFHTPYNEHIRINVEHDEPKLLVNGSPQSGRYIRWLWKKAFRTFHISKHFPVSKILMLGVGGGTAIKLLHETFPGAHITAIDIDSQMIDIAKFYFHLDNSGYVSFVQEDANKFVRQEAKKHKHYDMVIVDLFTGYVIPRFVTEISFLQALKEIISRPVGVCIFNYLRELQYAEKSNMLFGRLKRIFSYVSDFSIENNRFFFTSIV